MYKLCKTEQSAQRQRDFELALLRLMEQKNYYKITITDLCKEMGAPRKAFYRYFDSIDDVLDALLDYEYLESMKEVVNQIYEPFFLYWSNNRRLLDVLEKYGLSPRLISRAGQMVLLKYLDSAKDLSDLHSSCTSLLPSSGILHFQEVPQVCHQLNNILQ